MAQLQITSIAKAANRATNFFMFPSKSLMTLIRQFKLRENWEQTFDDEEFNNAPRWRTNARVEVRMKVVRNYTYLYIS